MSQFDADRDEVVADLREKEVGAICVGVDFETSKKAVELSGANPDILWATIGLHPTDNLKEEFDMEKYLKLGSDPKVVAIGECGLDYFRDQKPETKERQKELFKKHIELAGKLNKPLMIHARPSKDSMDAYEDVLILLESKAPKLMANFHFFVGDLETAKKILEKGWTISFDGPITFTSDYDEVIKNIPLANIMAETDAPFVSPVPYRGKKCEPWMVEEVIKKIAFLKNLSFKETVFVLNANVKRVFGIEI